MASVRNKAVFTCLICFILVHASVSHAAGTYYNSFQIQKHLDKEYFTILFGFVFLLPEIVEFDFCDNGTFSLKSDLWDEAAVGSYEKGIVLLRGQGTTGVYYSSDFEENIEIDYSFTGYPLGLSDFFMLGIGSREFTFEDGVKVSEAFIFEGPGF